MFDQTIGRGGMHRRAAAADVAVGQQRQRELRLAYDHNPATEAVQSARVRLQEPPAEVLDKPTETVTLLERLRVEVLFAPFKPDDRLRQPHLVEVLFGQQ